MAENNGDNGWRFGPRPLAATACLLIAVTTGSALAQPAGTAKLTTPGDAPKSLTAEDLKKQEAERKARADSLNKALADVLPLWQEILDKYPQSPRVEPALYYCGLAMAAKADAMSAVDPATTAAQAKLYSQAVETLGRLVEKFPKSPLAGDANVKIIDICLERLFDLAAAQKSASAAVEWAKANAEPSKTAPGELPGQTPATQPAPLAPWAVNSIRQPSPDAVKSTIDEIYLRSGMIALLNQDYQKAVEFFKLANPQPASSGFVPVKNLYSIGVAFLLAAATQKRSFTKEQVLADLKNGHQRTIILLADLYLWGLHPEKARSMYERILQGDSLLGPINSGLEAYAIFEIAATYNCERTGYDTAILWLSKLNDAKYKNTYWQAYAKFRTALYTVNKSGDLKKSFDLYQAIIDEYPNHPISELAHAYYCMNACVLKDKDRAIKASKTFFEKYPKSEWKPQIEKKLQELEQESQQ